jgi:hypothetical protein
MTNWTGACREPSCANVCLGLFQNTILWEETGACLVALSLIFTKQVVLQRGIGLFTEHHSIPRCSTTCFVKIKESDIRHAKSRKVILGLFSKFSPVSWWDKTYMLQIVLMYHGTWMKLVNTLCLSHLFYCKCHGKEASPTWMGDTFSLKISWKEYSVQNYSVFFCACCLYTGNRLKYIFTIYPHLVSTFIIVLCAGRSCFLSLICFQSWI